MSLVSTWTKLGSTITLKGYVSVHLLRASIDRVGYE